MNNEKQVVILQEKNVVNNRIKNTNNAVISA